MRIDQKRRIEDLHIDELEIVSKKELAELRKAANCNAERTILGHRVWSPWAEVLDGLQHCVEENVSRSEVAEKERDSQKARADRFSRDLQEIAKKNRRLEEQLGDANARLAQQQKEIAKLCAGKAARVDLTKIAADARAEVSEYFGSRNSEEVSEALDVIEQFAIALFERLGAAK